MKISVIIPVYNGEIYIDKCLSSLQEQAYQDWEAIIINDGSTDKSEKILQAYSSSDCRIKIISIPNSGVVQARDCGVRHASGEYIFFLDIDDTLVSHAFQVLIDKLTIYPEVDIVITGFNMIYDNNIGNFFYPNFNVSNELNYLRRVLIGKNGWELWAKLFRKNLFDSPLKLPVNIRIGEDAAVLVQLIVRAKVIVGCEEPVYNYIQYDESVSHRKSGELAEETLKAAFFIEGYLKTTSLYPDLKKEIGAMFLLFYSNSTRRGYLNRKHELVERIRKEHFSFSSFVLMPFYKAVYVVIYYWFGSIISKFI